MSATAEALATVELLEQILLECSVFDCARVQRTSKFWRNVLANSPKLRQHMFLEPTPAREILNNFGVISPISDLVEEEGVKKGRIIGDIHPAMGIYGKQSRGHYHLPKSFGVVVCLTPDLPMWKNGLWDKVRIVKHANAKTLYLNEQNEFPQWIDLGKEQTIGDLRDAVGEFDGCVEVYIPWFVEEASGEVKSLREATALVRKGENVEEEMKGLPSG